ncbi:MAG: flippase [Patescibacteria group bacterium]
MSLTRQVASNTFIQLLGRAASMVFGLLTVGLMTRYLGQEGFGQYTTIIAFLQFFGIIVDFGLAVIIVQLISARPAETAKLTSNIFTMRLLTALVFFALAPFLVWLFPYPLIIKWGVAVTAAAMLFTSLNQLVVGLFQRELKMGRATIAEVTGRAIIFLGTLLAVWQGQGLLAIMAAVVVGNFFNFCLSFYFSRSITKIKLAFDWPVWREVLQKTWPIGLSIVFNLIYFKADTVILSLYRSQAEVGVYGAAYKILEVLSVIPYMFMGLILPILSAAWARGETARFKTVMQKAWDFMAIVTLPVLFGGLALAESLIVFVAGPEFAAAGPVLRILLLATAAIYLSTVFNHAVVALGAQKKMLWGFAVVAVISLIGYFWLIPLYSYTAAAGITVVGEVLILLISGAVIYRAVGSLVNFKIFLRAFLASLVMACFLWLGQGNGWGLGWLLLLGVAVYAAALYIVGGVRKELLVELLRRS